MRVLGEDKVCTHKFKYDGKPTRILENSVNTLQCKLEL